MSDLSEKWKERNEQLEVEGGCEDEADQEAATAAGIVKRPGHMGKKMPISSSSPETWVKEAVQTRQTLTEESEDR